MEQIGNIINNQWALGENVKGPCEMHREHQILKKSHLPSPPHYLFPEWKKDLGLSLWAACICHHTSVTWKGFINSNHVRFHNFQSWVSYIWAPPICIVWQRASITSNSLEWPLCNLYTWKWVYGQTIWDKNWGAIRQVVMNTPICLRQPK